MLRCVFVFISTITLIAVIGLTSYGQGGASTSPLMGTVVDQSNAVMAGVDVVVKDKHTAAEFRGTTGSDGVFTIPALSVGTYTVTITAPGFKQVVVDNVKVEARMPSNIRVTLQIGNINDTVVVTGGAEIVQSQSAAISSTVTVHPPTPPAAGGKAPEGLGGGSGRPQ